MGKAPYKSAKEKSGCSLSLTMKERHMSCLQQLAMNNNIQRSHQEFQSQVLMAQNTLNSTMSP